MNEVEIIKEVQNGSLNAFAQLFELYKTQSIRIVYLITGDMYLSEDIVQEAFIKCYHSVKNLNNTELFKSWFFKLLTRMSWKYIDRQKKLVPFDDISQKADEEKTSESLNNFVQNEQYKELHAEIKNLELKQRTTIVLYYFNDMSIKEISKIMGCFEGTVKSRLYTARNKLKISLQISENNNIKERRCSDGICKFI